MVPSLLESPNSDAQINSIRVDPSLQSIWVRAASTFRTRTHHKVNVFDRVGAAKDLFQLISSISAPCSGAKSVASLAPVARVVHGVVVELFEGDVASKKERKALKEVKSLVGVMLGFMNVCCCGEAGPVVVSESGLSFKEMGGVWLDGDEGVGELMPLVSEEMVGEICEGGVDVRYLAGVVIAELFLLKMCLDRRGGSSEEDLRTWAVGSVTGFKNVYLFEVLLRMLLEKTLPVTSLVSSEDEVLLRKVLYDAIVLVEYYFLDPEKAIHVTAEHMKLIAMKRLILAHEAVEYFRKCGDQKRSISYTTAFSSSQLYSQIVRWVKSQISVEDSSVKSMGSSSKALLKWLLNLERQGFLVFGDSILKYHTLDMFKPPASKLDSKEMDDDNVPIFYIDNKKPGEHIDEAKINENINTFFVSAGNAMTSAEKRGKKRKGESSESEEESSLSDKTRKGNSSESEEESSLSDDSDEDME